MRILNSSNEPERIILGIDPGTSVMGYGLIIIRKGKMELLQFGVIHLKKYPDHALKLKKIYERISQLIEEYAPDEIALEAPFFGKNVQSMLKLGRAQGVAMAAALVKDIPVNEYAPRKVKQAVTGKGTASKELVCNMILKLLNMKEAPKLLDATDALGVAICHYYQTTGASQISTKKANSWGTFLKNNPERQK
ncbi:MAG: crossover junction endodeoxyribonuclease RuvC [Cytophagales bacterium]|nr:crossover junction endodeoxyribonuclease RuvC [Cytophagales bacterium]